MGFKDRMVGIAKDTVASASDAVSERVSDANEAHLAKKDVRDAEIALAKSFHETRSFGRMSVDSASKLVRFKDAVKFQPTAASKAGKATAAVFTAGLSLIASAAIEHPKDKIVSFDEIRGYQVLEDDSVIQSGGLGSAVVGGVLFGAVGAVAGAMGGAKATSKFVESMVLRVDIDDIDYPCILIPIVEKRIKRSGKDYQKALKESQEIAQCLEMILSSTGRKSS